MATDWSQFSDTKPTSYLDDALNGIDIASKVNTVQNIPSSKEVDWSQFSTTPPKTKGNVDWSQFSDSPPENNKSILNNVLSNIDNVTKVVPKTKAPVQQLDTLSSKVNSYKDINLHGMQYPERTLTDVLTGRLGTPQEVQDRINQQLSDYQHQDSEIQDVSDELMPYVGFVPKGSIELKYLGDAVKSGSISNQVIKQHEPLLKAVQSGDVSPKVANNIIQSDPKIQQALKQKSFTDIIAENVSKEPEPITNLIDKHLVDMGEEPHFKTSEELSPIQEEANPLDNPRLNELLDMRENVSAKDARSPQVIDKKGDVVYNNDIGNTTSFEYPSYSKNYNYDFKITKNDVRDIRNGTAKPETIEKLKSDLDTLDNHPDYMKEEPISVDGSPLFSKAYHGTPHEVDAFDTAKIGTGEGAQAYGHGLYFAQDKKTAEWYRDTLGADWSDAAKFEANRSGGDFKKAIEKTKQTISDIEPKAESSSFFKNHLQSQKNKLRELEAMSRGEKPQGNLYKVELKPKEDEYLHWDKLLSEQSDKVKQALSEVEMKYPFNIKESGEEIYKRLRNKFGAMGGGDKKASEILHERGIKGIKYVDGNSRNIKTLHITPPERTVSGKWMVKSDDYNSVGKHFNTESEAKAYLKSETENAQHNYVIFHNDDIEVIGANGKYYDPIMKDELFSKGGKGTTTPEAIHQSAKKLLGKNYDNLKGDINIVQSYKDLPKELVDNGVEFSSGGKVRGIFNPKDGKVHLVADTMKPEEVNGVLVHELLHKAEFSGEKILGESHDTLVLRLKQLKDEPLVKQAFKSAKDAGTDAKNINREMMSYLVEKYQLGIDMSPKLKQFVRNIIDAVKVFASKTAVKLGVDAKWLISKMNEKDIAALLKSSAIKQEVKTVTKDSEALFSKTPIKEQLINTVDKATEILQDYWKPAEKILLKTDKNMSFKLGEKVNDARKSIYGRTGERIAQVRDAQQLIVNNITKYSKLIGEDTEAIRKDLNSFMIAQHAPERNRALQDGAAGINTRTALKSLIDLRKNNPEKYNFLSNMANDVRKLNEKTLDILKDGQVITPELHTELRNKYKMHVPLQRIMPEEKETAGIITGGKGFSVKSTGIKVAKGSDLEVSDILGNVSANIQEAIIRVEKNRVGLAMYDLFKADKSLGEARGLMPKGVDDKGIPVKDFSGKPIMEDITKDMIVLFKDGKKKVIIPNDPIIAKVYNQLNVEDKGIIASTIAPITRTMAGLYTRYSPEFSLSNIIRDIQEAFVYNSAEMSGKDAIRALGNQPWSVKAVTESLLGKDTEGARLYHQMKMDGGTTGGINISTRGKVHQDVDDMFKLAKSNPRKALKGVLDFIEHYNTIFEDSTRLAAYKQALEKGLSRDRAATIAKETSIDFDRKGTATPWVNSIYMFSNASIQGSYKMIKAFKNPKVLASTVGIISGISVAVDSHNDTVDPDWRNKVNDFERTSNYVILLDNKDGNLRRINIPIGWGFKPIKTMVESLRDISVGKSQGNPVTRVLSSIGQSYMPVNGRDIWSDITPSVLSALKDVHDNINWKGQMISPKGMDLAQPSDKYFPTTPETLGGRLAINLVIGTEKIGIDLTPEDIKYLVSTYGGGPLNFSTGIVNMLTSATKGDSIKPEDMVMARRFYKETNPDRLDKYEGSQAIKKMVQKVQQGDTVQDRIKIIQQELPKIDEKDRAKAVYTLKYGGLLPNKQSVIRDVEKAQWSEDILNPFTSSTDTKK